MPRWRLACRGSCDDGVAHGCTGLGLLLIDGGPDDDFAEAARRFGQGCEKDDPRSCRNLASLHQIGQGVPKDAARARELLDKACSGGDAEACRPVSR